MSRPKIQIDKCLVNFCKEPSNCKGYCSTHYQQIRRTGKIIENHDTIHKIIPELDNDIALERFQKLYTGINLIFDKCSKKDIKVEERCIDTLGNMTTHLINYVLDEPNDKHMQKTEYIDNLDCIDDL